MSVEDLLKQAELRANRALGAIARFRDGMPHADDDLYLAWDELTTAAKHLDAVAVERGQRPLSG